MEVKDLFECVKTLEENQYLGTSFGSDSFTIEKLGENDFVLKVWRTFKVFEMLPIRELYFGKNGIPLWLVFQENPSWYARNVFTGNLINYDNLSNMLKAFKSCNYSQDMKYIK